VPSNDWWAWLVGVSIGIVAVLAAIKVVGMVIAALYHAIARMEAVADLLLGDKAKGKLPLETRLTSLEADRDQLKAAMHAHPDPHTDNRTARRGRP